MRTWFNNAGDRNGGRKKRDKRQVQHETAPQQEPNREDVADHVDGEGVDGEGVDGGGIGGDSTDGGDFTDGGSNDDSDGA